VSHYATHPDLQSFEASRAMFHALIEQPADPVDAGHPTHTELEQLLTTRARELMRQPLQAYLDLRAQREQRLGALPSAGGEVMAVVQIGEQAGLGGFPAEGPAGDEVGRREVQRD